MSSEFYSQHLQFKDLNKLMEFDQVTTKPKGYHLRHMIINSTVAINNNNFVCTEYFIQRKKKIKNNIYLSTKCLEKM